MDIKELISTVRKENELVIHKQEELERLIALCGVAGVSFEEKISATPNPNGQEMKYLNCIMYKKELEKFINDSVVKRSVLMKFIDSLEDNREIRIMYMYCLENRSKAYIAKNMNYTKQRIHQMYNDTLEKLALRFDDILINFNS